LKETETQIRETHDVGGGRVIFSSALIATSTSLTPVATVAIVIDSISRLYLRIGLKKLLCVIGYVTQTEQADYEIIPLIPNTIIKITFKFQPLFFSFSS
jgi:hypothetical protein